MGTKMKGVLKGLRYITQIFEDEKEPEMQIGFPTDVKHVAHIGWDGPTPSVDNSPSWMKEYKASEGTREADDKSKKEDLHRGSQDSSSRSILEPQNNLTRVLPDLPKSSRHNSLADGDGSSTSSMCPKESIKSRQSRRNSSDSSKPVRKQKDQGQGSNSPSRILPKKSSRKKSKEKSKGDVCTKSRIKAATPLADTYTSPFSDPGPDIHDTRTVCDRKSFLQCSSLMRLSDKEEDKG